MSIGFVLAFFTSSIAQRTPEQETQIDSIKQEIASSKHDTTIVISWLALEDIAFPNLNISTNQKVDSLCLLNLKKGLNEKTELTFLYARASAKHNLGIIYYLESDFIKAIRHYEEAIAIRKKIKDEKGLANTYNNIGVIYKYQGDYSKAIEYFGNSLKVQEKLKNNKGIAAALNNIGLIHYNNESYSKAVEYYKQSLSLRQEIGNKNEIAYSLNNIGNTYFAQKNYPKAIEYLDRSRELNIEINDSIGLSLSLSNLANVYSEQGDDDLALDFYYRSLRIEERVGEKNDIAITLFNIGSLYDYQGKIKLAIDFYERSLKISKETDALKSIEVSAKALSELYKKQGNHQQALKLYEEYISARDSLDSEENQKAIIRQEYQYQYEQQAAKDSIQTLAALRNQEARLAKEKADKREAEASSKRNQIIIYFGIAIIAVILFFVYMVLKSLRLVREQKAVVEIQKAKVDEAYGQLEEKNTEILDSINYAKRIQSAILPPDKLVKEYLHNSFVLYKPKDIVAGDFYWMEPITQNAPPLILFAAADCTGHGVPGAMVSVVCNNGLNRSVREYGLTEPGEILDKTREIVISEFEKSEEEVKDGMDVALCYLQGRTVKYAGAHNPLWIIRKGTEEVEEIKAHKQPIGKYTEPSPYPTHTIELNEGDTFYIFSDGFADQFGGAKGKKFKAANFKKLLLSIQNDPLERQKELIDQAFENWKGSLEQLDDVCVIGVRV